MILTTKKQRCLVCTNGSMTRPLRPTKRSIDLTSSISLVLVLSKGSLELALLICPLFLKSADLLYEISLYRNQEEIDTHYVTVVQEINVNEKTWHIVHLYKTFAKQC